MAPRPLADTLKLAGRVSLDEGEALTGSGKVAADSGMTRWALISTPDGPAVILGVGPSYFGTREDDAGSWTAGADQTAAINAARRALRDEVDAMEARWAEDETARKIAALQPPDGPPRSLADLRAELNQLETRIAEIQAGDNAINTARRNWNGQGDDPSEALPHDYAQPGEYNAVRKRAYLLRTLPDVDTYGPDGPRPIPDDEYERMEARYDELQTLNTNEVYPTGYTARVRVDQVDELRAALEPAIERGDAVCAAGVAWWNRHDELEAAGDTEALAEHRATEPSMDYQIMAEGVIRCEWGDIGYRVDLEEFGAGPSVVVGVIPHFDPQVSSLEDLSGNEQAATLTTDEARKFTGTLARVSSAAATLPAGPPPPALRTTTTRVTLGPAFENVVEALREALNTTFDRDGAIQQYDEHFAALGELNRQCGQLLLDHATDLEDTPLAGTPAEHVGQVGDALITAGNAGDKVWEEWAESFGYERKRQYQPRPGESTLNVNHG
jgi:hypothetical protein